MEESGRIWNKFTETRYQTVNAHKLRYSPVDCLLNMTWLSMSILGQGAQNILKMLLLAPVKLDFHETFHKQSTGGYLNL